VIIRIFDTAVDPNDIEKAKELFRSQVEPAFAKFGGCNGIEMAMGVEEHSRDLIDVVAVSRWDSQEAIAEATRSEEYAEALKEIRALFMEAPIVRHFEVVE
jgi:heme-degrading monooxygenase HmoA